MNGIVMLTIVLVALMILGVVLGLHALRQEAKSKKPLSGYQPSMILVDTVGAIILREYDKVYVEKDNPYRSAGLAYDNYYFIYDNVRVVVKTIDKGNYVYSCEFSVGSCKKIELTDDEKKKLYNYVKEAINIKNAKIEAEKEKQRQLEACDALENLLKPEVSMLKKDNSTLTVSTVTASTNTNTCYTIFNNS